MSLNQTTDANFAADVLQSELPVLVDFWAEWCGPCKMLMPTLEELAPTLAGKVKIVKVNIDANPQVPAQFGVRSIPTLVLFNKGEAVSTKVGVMTKTKLTEWLNASV